VLFGEIMVVCCGSSRKHINEDNGATCGLFLVLGLGCTNPYVSVVNVAVILSGNVNVILT
jgi:hypothetical protein